MFCQRKIRVVGAVIVLLGWLYVGQVLGVNGAEPAEGQGKTVGPAAIEASSGAYIGRITGDKVHVRSGPSEVFYPVALLEKGQEVIVRKELRGWAQIEATQQCFSYVSQRYVELQKVLGETSEVGEVESAGEGRDSGTVEPKEPVSGLAALVGKETILAVVTGNNVRVRAGSIKVPPAHADEVQSKLNKGAEVRVIGQRDNFYKIVTPADCYFWVALDYVEQIRQVTAEEVAAKKALADQAVGDETGRAEEILKQIEKDRQSYQVLALLLRQEREKPLSQQKLDLIRTKLDGLLASTPSPSVKAAAGALERQLRKCEMVVNVWRQAHDPPEKKAEDMIVKGRLAYSSIFTTPNKNRRFLVFDEHDRIIYYAISDKDGLDLSAWVGKEVTMVGKAQYDAFGKIRLLKVVQVVEMLPKE